ncbi:MAG: hypothetical protein R6U94_13750 [Nitriliruptoraceae bacterium]
MGSGTLELDFAAGGDMDLDKEGELTRAAILDHLDGKVSDG